jgi:uncharacterized protein
MQIIMRKSLSLLKSSSLLLITLLFVGCTSTSLDAPKSEAAKTEALFTAIKENNPDALRWAVYNGANPNSQDSKGTPAIVYAAQQGANQIIEVMIKMAGVDINATNTEDETAIMITALKGNYRGVDLLLDKAAQPNRLPKTGWTALHYAAKHGSVPILQLLIANHADINALSPNGTTPLMLAARHENAAAFQLLLTLGADSTRKNDAGYSATDYALQSSNNAMARAVGSIRHNKPAVYNPHDEVKSLKY